MRLLFAVQKQLVKIESPLQEGGKLKLMLWQMAGNASEFAESQTPKRACLRIPTGHVVVNSKWRNSIFVSVLQGATITYEENLGYLDFQPASQIGIVYATEADLECQASLKRKLVKLRKANEVQVVVLAEKTALSSQYYPALQKFVAMELGFQITPVPSQREAAGLVSQIVHSESEFDNNPFRKKRKSKNLDEALLSTVQSIPKLGGVKACKLLENFNSLQTINEASPEELASVVGKSSAQNIRQFLDTNIHPSWR